MEEQKKTMSNRRQDSFSWLENRSLSPVFPSKSLVLSIKEFFPIFFSLYHTEKMLIKKCQSWSCSHKFNLNEMNERKIKRNTNTHTHAHTQKKRGKLNIVNESRCSNDDDEKQCISMLKLAQFITVLRALLLFNISIYNFLAALR